MLCWYAAFACSKQMMAMSNDETQAMHSAANAGPIELLACGSGSQIPRCSCGCTTGAASTSNHSRPFTAWVQHLSIALAPPRGKGRDGRWKAVFETLTCPIIQDVCTGTAASKSNVQGGDEVENWIERLWFWRQKGGRDGTSWAVAVGGVGGKKTKLREGNVVALVVAVECRPFTTLLHPRPLLLGHGCLGRVEGVGCLGKEWTRQKISMNCGKGHRHHNSGQLTSGSTTTHHSRSDKIHPSPPHSHRSRPRLWNPIADGQ